jgi:hypothetical protein
VRYLNLLVVLILGLAAYRGARLISNDTITKPIRDKLYGLQSHGRLGKWAHSLITCPWCVSVWLSAFAVIWWIWLILPAWPGWGETLLAWWAVAGVAGLAVGADRSLEKYVHEP